MDNHKKKYKAINLCIMKYNINTKDKKPRQRHVNSVDLTKQEQKLLFKNTHIKDNKDFSKRLTNCSTITSNVTNNSITNDITQYHKYIHIKPHNNASTFHSISNDKQIKNNNTIIKHRANTSKDVASQNKTQCQSRSTSNKHACKNKKSQVILNIFNHWEKLTTNKHKQVNTLCNSISINNSNRSSSNNNNNKFKNKLITISLPQTKQPSISNSIEVEHRRCVNKNKHNFYNKVIFNPSTLSKQINSNNNNNNNSNNYKQSVLQNYINKPKQNMSLTLNTHDHDIITSFNSSDASLISMNTQFNNIKQTSPNNKQFNIYSTLIQTYIKVYYSKYHKYPSTKYNFYSYGRLIGKGAFGKVNLSLHNLTGLLVAIKSINKKSLTSLKQKQKLQNEISIMKTLSQTPQNPFTVQLYETYETNNHICLVMEHLQGGDLLNYIRKRNSLSELTAKCIFKKLILSIKHIHSNNIVHRDIKLDNILLDLNSDIKLCDFGVSSIYSKGELMMQQCGTPAYIAPEILYNKGYDGRKVDIWSSGVVLYAILKGAVPFKGKSKQDLFEKIMKGEFEMIENISNEGKDLIRRLLEVDPKKRINVNEILTHKWFDNCNEDVNLFSKAEKAILSRGNNNYKHISEKECYCEMFTQRNLDTENNDKDVNNKSKSFILTPYNTSVNEDDNEYDSELKIENEITKFEGKVNECNYNYVINNNKEVDNGVIISKQYHNDINPNNIHINNNINNNISVSPFLKSKCNSTLSTPPNEKLFSNLNPNTTRTTTINEFIYKQMNDLGYNRSYLQKCIKSNTFNYGTTGVFLLHKYSNSNS